ncbi:MAG: hypothetical protein IKO56_05790 [Alphaproteobacteria bacterium]|nr:hypothetical protein [Alphaproteobacteria bacterium]
MTDTRPLTPEILLNAGWKLNQSKPIYTDYVKDLGINAGSFLSVMFWKSSNPYVQIDVNVDEDDRKTKRMTVVLYRQITVNELNTLLTIMGFVEYTI